jgi:hypothetical protein
MAQGILERVLGEASANLRELKVGAHVTQTGTCIIFFAKVVRIKFVWGISWQVLLGFGP